MLLPVLLAAITAVTPQEAPAQTPAPPGTLKTTPIAPAEAGGGGAQSALEAGLAAFKRRRFTRAETEFSRAVAADPGSAAAHFYLGYTHYKMGEPARRMNAHKEQARQEFARAFELDPAFRPVWLRSK